MPETVMRSLSKLLKFLSWYGLAVATLLYLLPLAAQFLESGYEALSSTARFFAVIGVFAVVATWHALATRDRWRAWGPGRQPSWPAASNGAERTERVS